MTSSIRRAVVGLFHTILCAFIAITLLPGAQPLLPSALRSSVEANAAKKKPVKYVVIARATTADGTLKGRGTSKIEKGKSKEFIGTPKKGFKTGFLVNGKLVKFQTDAAIKKAVKSKKKGATNLAYTLKKVGANALVEAIFVKVGSPFAKNVGVSLNGLGATIQVTNVTPAAFSGFAESNVGIKSVKWTNTTNNQSGNVNGKESWTANIPLAIGDNIVKFTVVALDGSSYQTEIVITNYTNLDFTGPLSFTKDVVFVNEPQNVTFSIGIQEPTGAAVSLVSVDANGVPDGVVTQAMSDTGVLPDEINADGVFTTSLSVGDTVQTFKRYRVKVVKPSGTYFSEIAKIWVTSHLTSALIDAVAVLADSVAAQYDALKAQKKTDDAIFAALLVTIKATPGVGGAGIGPKGGVWWITDSGVLGFFTPDKAGQKGGTRAEEAAAAEALPVRLEPNPTSTYTNADMQHLSGIPGLAQIQSLAAANRIKSKKAAIVSPFISNPNYTGGNFGNTDDLYGPWAELKAKGSACSMEAVQETVNNGSVNVSLANFSDVDRFGYIHFSTHGDNLYNGLLSLWKDVWGTNDWLKAYNSVVVMLTGLKIPKNPDGTWNYGTFEADILAKRLAVSAGGSIAVLPGFFQMYLKPLPNSLVVLGACRSSFNASLANTFLAKGAGSVLGFTDYVSSSYAQNTSKEVILQMLTDKTVAIGFSSATGKYGVDDNDKDPAKFTLFGANDLQFPAGALENGSFEENGLTPWDKTGDGRVISQLGAAQPPDGSKMGIISTGLGLTTSSGQIEQVFCVPSTATSIDMQWNFFSEEFLEYCSSIYQDFFDVELCVIPDDLTQPESCSTAFHTQISTLCGGGQVSPAGVHFDRPNGDVYTTGWRPMTLPIASYQGKKLRVRLKAGDVGDSIYDSAILIDKILVLPIPTTP